jgi:homoserine dehydrogenase
VLGEHGVSVKSVVQKGLSEGSARMVMVVHRVAEAQFYEAMAQIAELAPVRARPRAIRVVEEQFG